MRDYGHRRWLQTGSTRIVALELLDAGAWTGVGVLGAEALPAAPFLELLGDYGSPHGIEKKESSIAFTPPAPE